MKMKKNIVLEGERENVMKQRSQTKHHELHVRSSPLAYFNPSTIQSFAFSFFFSIFLLSSSFSFYILRMY